MAGYTKLFNSILDSTIWQEPNETRLLWITMLAMSDSNGEIQSSVPGLARRAGISLEECERGLHVLASPDHYSRTKDHEGRRIAEVQGGWRLLNHGRYRALLSYEERKEYNRIKQAERRKKLSSGMSKNVKDCQLLSMTVNDNQQCKHIADSRVQIPEREKSALARSNPSIDSGTVTSTTAALFDQTAKKINSMNPRWRTALVRTEQDEMMANSRAFFDLTEDDWNLLRSYMHTAIPETWGKFWQPDTRSQFIRSIGDIVAHADRWAQECRRRKIPTGTEVQSQPA